MRDLSAPARRSGCPRRDPSPRRPVRQRPTAACRLLAWLLLALALPVHASPSVAFFYGKPLPVGPLSAFDQVVVETANVSAAEQARLSAAGTELYAYLSVGEVARSRPWYGELDPAWRLGKNPHWDSDVMDLRSGWQEYLLERRMRPLWDKGYRGFFLDTLDSYLGLAAGEAQREQQKQGLIALIEAMTKRFPGVRLLFNRGFEVLPAVAGRAQGLVAESLFQGWDPASRQYRPVPEQDREWLLARLAEARDRYRLPVTVIDYVPPRQRALARQTARRIAALGFTPWVATPALDYLGVGSIEPIPRRVMLLYDSAESALPYTETHRFLATPLEYLGYTADYLDVRAPLPEQPLAGRYAGIVSWLPGNRHPHPAAYRDWLLRQIDAGVPVVFMNHLGFEPDSEFLSRLGLERSDTPLRPPMRISRLDPTMTFEARPHARSRELPNLRARDPAIVSWLQIQDADDQTLDPVLIASWGGMALAPYLTMRFRGLEEDAEEERRWYPNPFAFLRRALRLPAIPVPDMTTENGRRLLTAHIDGDGFYNRSQLPGHQYAAQVILDQVLARYPLPHTVSVVEGEIGPTGLRPDLTPIIEPIARRIFARPNVEPASHTYSHPFNWSQALEAAARAPAPATAHDREAKLSELYRTGSASHHLPLPGYRFNIEREVKGSVEYVDQRLTPADKPVRVFLWSGDALPPESALAWCRRLGIANLNGGDTRVTRDNPSLTAVSPSGIPHGPYFQPYAPVQNENLYTHNWRGPYYGYRRVVETFEFTGNPRRLKPIGIYYHFYTGERQASLTALHQVYAWAMARETLPLWIGEYTPKVQDFRDTTLARDLDGGWRVDGVGHLRTLRLDTEAGWPDLQRSQGVIGITDTPQGRYVSLDGSASIRLYLSDRRPRQPHLRQANARVRYWRPDGDGIALRLRGHLPVRLEIAAASGCRLHAAAKQKVRQRLEQDTLIVDFPGKDTGDARLRCR